MSVHPENIIVQREFNQSDVNTSPEVQITVHKANPTVKVHLQKIEEVCATYGTHPTKGLDSETVKLKSKTTGLNRLTPPSTNYLRKFAGYVFGGFNSLMWLAAVLSFLSYKPLGGPHPAALSMGIGVLLIIVICASTFFYAYVDWNASKMMKSIRSLVAEQAIVIRDGKEERIDAKNIVVGDVVLLSIGQRVPADIRLIEVSADLKFDRSLLTGESELVPGTVEPTDENPLETKNLALSSTFVTQGRARGIVFEIGDNTVIGHIVKMSGKQRTTLTPIQKGINTFTIIISTLAISFFIIAMLVWSLWIRIDYPGYDTASMAIINAIGCLTAFVPSGLPVCFALSLTIIARRMAAQKVLVKNLTSIETLGCMSVLCSDKTGTLTMGKMFVQSATFFDKTISVTDAPTDKEKEIPALKDLFMIASICNDAVFLHESGNENLPISERPINGDSTDAAILRYSEQLRSLYPNMDHHSVLFNIPFNSKNKYMAKLIRFGAETPRLFVKGAPDILLANCTKALQSDGTVVELSPENVAKVVQAQEEASSQGLRVLALCQKTFADLSEVPCENQEEMEKFVSGHISGLTLVGLLSIRDPPRHDTLSTVQTMRGAGVRVFMVTGDSEMTAVAIAKQVGIVTAEKPYHFAHLKSLNDSMEANPNKHNMKPQPGEPIQAISITGKDLQKMSEADWDYCARHFTEMVFSRTTPEQKLQIVENLKMRGDNIVAVTGDGTNDAPALKAADIGVAMGSGTDVAREAATMILLNNDFGSLLVGIENGRLVFENIKKVLMYLMPAGSYAEFMPVLINVFFGMQLAMSSFLQVVFCVANDVVMSISVMYEKPESNLMKRPPRNPRVDKLTDWKFFFHIYLIFGVGIWVSGFAMWFLYMHLQGLGFYDLVLVYSRWKDGWAGKSIEELTSYIQVGQCVYYVCLAIMQFGSLMAVRNRHVSVIDSNPLWGPRQNLVIPFSMISTIIICIICLYGPGLEDVFGTSPIPTMFWFIPFGLSFGNFLLDEIRKLIVRRYPNSIVAKIAW